MSTSSFHHPSLKILWQAVTSEPMDFQSWTALLSQVEAFGSVGDAQQAYDGFLRQFPLCFGYWRKYASLARRHAARSAIAKTQDRDAQGGEDASGPSMGAAAESMEVAAAAARATNGAAQAREIFELAVSAAPYCLDLWEAFVEDTMEEGFRRQRGVDVEEIRRVYERALEAVGDNPGAGGLWRRCVAFEEAQSGEQRRVFRLYERAFGYRLADLEALWVGFRDLAERTSWDDLAPPCAAPDPAGKGTSSVKSDEAPRVVLAPAQAPTAKKGVTSVAAVQAASEGGTKADKKERFVKILENRRKAPLARGRRDMRSTWAWDLEPRLNPRLPTLLRGVLGSFASLRGRERRESFERRITRRHFHVKPLDDAQLSAWSEFLDFEISQQVGEGETGDALPPRPSTATVSARDGNPTAANPKGRKRSRGSKAAVSRGCDVERLFERCLVPCASYWWLWERYALWKESVWGVEAALEVAERACSPFLQWRPEALFFRAELLERIGRTDDARGVYRRVLSEVAPGLVEAACKLACFERRCGDRQAADRAYRLLLPPPLGNSRAVETALTDRNGLAAGWEETTETTRPYLYMQLARFQHRILGDAAAARTTFRAAVADVPSSRELWLAFLEFEAAQPQALHTGRVEAAFRMAVEEGVQGVGAGGGGGGREGVHGEEARRLTVEDRADLWEWFEEFVEDLSMDIAKVMSVRAEHRAWTQAHGAGAHEVLAAIAAGASELVDPTDDFPAAGSGGRNGSTRARRSDRDEIGRGSEQAGVAGAEVGWTAHGAMGSSATVAAAGPASDGGGAQRFAGQQWSPYYQQQASVGGVASMASPPVVFPTYSPAGQHQQQQQLFGSQPVADPRSWS